MIRNLLEFGVVRAVSQEAEEVLNGKSQIPVFPAKPPSIEKAYRMGEQESKTPRHVSESVLTSTDNLGFYYRDYVYFLLQSCGYLLLLAESWRRPILVDRLACNGVKAERVKRKRGLEENGVGRSTLQQAVSSRGSDGLV